MPRLGGFFMQFSFEYIDLLHMDKETKVREELSSVVPVGGVSYSSDRSNGTDHENLFISAGQIIDRFE